MLDSERDRRVEGRREENEADVLLRPARMRGIEGMKKGQGVDGLGILCFLKKR